MPKKGRAPGEVYQGPKIPDPLEDFIQNPENQIDTVKAEREAKAKEVLEEWRNSKPEQPKPETKETGPLW